MRGVSKVGLKASMEIFPGASLLLMKNVELPFGVCLLLGPKAQENLFSAKNL